MSNSDTSSVRPVERLIWLLAGCAMGILGISLAYFGYRILNDGRIVDHEWAYATTCMIFSFFLLRGAWFTVIPEKEEEVIKLSHER